RYQVMVLSVCRRHCRSEGEADDAFQTTWVCLAQSASQIRDGRRLAGWLHRVAMRASRQSRQSSMDQTAEAEDVVDRSIDVLEDVARRHDAGILDEELLRLPPHHKTAILLHVIHGESYENIAERLDTTINSVRGWVQRGKRTLARRLRRRGVVPVAAFAATLHTTVTRDAAADCLDRIDWSRPEEGNLPEPAMESVDGFHALPQKLSFLSNGNGLMKVATLVFAAATVVGVSMAWLDNLGADAEPMQAVTESDGKYETQELGSPPMRMEALAQFGQQQIKPPERKPPKSKPVSPFEKVLDETFAIDAKKVAISELADVLTEQLKVPVLLDRQAVEELGEDTLREWVTIENSVLPLRSVLYRALQPLELAAVTRKEGIFITADYAQLARRGVADSVWVSPDQATMGRLREKLNKTVSFNFVELALFDALREISLEVDMPILLDEIALGDLGIDPLEPITFSLSNCSARDFLDSILAPLELALSVQSSVLRVTTADEAESQAFIRIYFLEGVGDGSADDLDSITGLIETTIHSDTWEALGGQSTIAPFVISGERPALIVSTTMRTHREIEKLLAPLRQTPSSKKDSTSLPSRNLSEKPSPLSPITRESIEWRIQNQEASSFPGNNDPFSN
ncbi:MAG: sigma-70 family RNA polymerase sigma factor, partial [Planctomycetota bacterium]